LFANVVSQKFQRGFFPLDANRRNVIGDGRNVNFAFGGFAGRCHSVNDELGAAFPFFPFGVGVAFLIHFQRGHHSDQFFFVDLHSASDGVTVGRAIQSSGFDQRRAAKQQAGALRAAQAFAA
jgi:hypothetical protein